MPLYSHAQTWAFPACIMQLQSHMWLFKFRSILIKIEIRNSVPYSHWCTNSFPSWRWLVATLLDCPSPSFMSLYIEFWEMSLDQSLTFFHFCFPCVYSCAPLTQWYFLFQFINVFRLTLQVWVAQTLHIPKKGLTSELALGQLLEVELFESWNILSDKSTFVVFGHIVPI